MSIIRFPYSNSLHFVRLEDYALLQTDTTRLYFDLDYEKVDATCQFIKFTTSESLWLQYRTDYVDTDEYSYIKAYLVKYVDETTTTEVDITTSINFDFADLGDGVKQHQLLYDMSALDGRYHIRFEFVNFDKPEATYQSQWFEVNASYTYHNFIEWSNSGDLATNDDGIIWGGLNQFMWVDSRLSNNVYFKDSAIIDTATGKKIQTQSTMGKGKVWQVEPVHPYVAETINIALGKSKFYVNGERYVTEDTLETERLGDLNEYPFEIVLRLVEDVHGNGYEDYTQDQELTGSLPVFPDVVRTTGLQDRTTGLQDRTTNN